MKSLWVYKDALQDMVLEANRTYPLETGGVLVGYVAENEEPVIFSIVGPGPKAIHKRYWFFPDHEWQCEKLDVQFEQSGGKMVYLGDWHTHPDGLSRMSWLDRRTLCTIARHEEAKVPNPVMMIGGGCPDAWSWGGYIFAKASLFGILADYSAFNIRLFDKTN